MAKQTQTYTSTEAKEALMAELMRDGGSFKTRGFDQENAKTLANVAINEGLLDKKTLEKIIEIVKKHVDNPQFSMDKLSKLTFDINSLRISKHLLDRTPAKDTEFKGFAQKKEGRSSGEVKTRNADDSLFMIKTAPSVSPPDGEDTLAVLHELTTAPLLQRILRDGTALIIPVHSVNYSYQTMSEVQQGELQEGIIGFFYVDENLICKVGNREIQVTDERMKKIIGSSPLQNRELQLTEKDKQRILEATSLNGLTPCTVGLGSKWILGFESITDHVGDFPPSIQGMEKLLIATVATANFDINRGNIGFVVGTDGASSFFLVDSGLGGTNCYDDARVMARDIVHRYCKYYHYNNQWPLDVKKFCEAIETVNNIQMDEVERLISSGLDAAKKTGLQLPDSIPYLQNHVGNPVYPDKLYNFVATDNKGRFKEIEHFLFIKTCTQLYMLRVLGNALEPIKLNLDLPKDQRNPDWKDGEWLNFTTIARAFRQLQTDIMNEAIKYKPLGLDDGTAADEERDAFIYLRKSLEFLNKGQRDKFMSLSLEWDTIKKLISDPCIFPYTFPRALLVLVSPEAENFCSRYNKHKSTDKHISVKTLASMDPQILMSLNFQSPTADKDISAFIAGMHPAVLEELKRRSKDSEFMYETIVQNLTSETAKMLYDNNIISQEELAAISPKEMDIILSEEFSKRLIDKNPDAMSMLKEYKRLSTPEPLEVPKRQEVKDLDTDAHKGSEAKIDKLRLTPHVHPRISSPFRGPYTESL